MTKADNIYKTLLELQSSLYHWKINHNDISTRGVMSRHFYTVQSQVESFCQVYQIASGERLNPPKTMKIKPKYSKSYLTSIIDLLNGYALMSKDSAPDLERTLVDISTILRSITYEVQRTW
jgi:hypothetical protein